MLVAILSAIALFGVAHISESPAVSLREWMGSQTQPGDDVDGLGRHHRKFEGLTMMEKLPREVVPTADNDRRLIIIGDIHGMDTSLNRLLDHIGYDGRKDHIIAAGDMVNKGPHSSKVIARLMELGASAVRGNHEDRVLLALASAQEQDEAGESVSYPDFQDRRSKKSDRDTARQLSREQVKWLAQRPLIIDAEALAMYVVHAGLVPGIRPVKQDPWAVMNMRSLIEPPKHFSHPAVPKEDLEVAEKNDEEEEDEVADLDEDADTSLAPEDLIPVDTHEGRKWAALWDRRQSQIRKANRRTVVYGHDAKRGLTVGKYTFGLDSACVNGGELTALVIHVSKKGHLKSKIRQVPCTKYKR